MTQVSIVMNDVFPMISYANPSCSHVVERQP
jgi:hypothetical protein